MDFLGMVETCRNCGPQHFWKIKDINRYQQILYQQGWSQIATRPISPCGAWRSKRKLLGCTPCSLAIRKLMCQSLSCHESWRISTLHLGILGFLWIWEWNRCAVPKAKVLGWIHEVQLQHFDHDLQHKSGGIATWKVTQRTIIRCLRCEDTSVAGSSPVQCSRAAERTCVFFSNVSRFCTWMELFWLRIAFNSCRLPGLTATPPNAKPKAGPDWARNGRNGRCSAQLPRPAQRGRRRSSRCGTIGATHHDNSR